MVKRTLSVFIFFQILLVFIVCNGSYSADQQKTDKTPVLLIHGLGGNAKGWDPFLLTAMNSKNGYIFGGVIRSEFKIKNIISNFTNPLNWNLSSFSSKANLFVLEMNDNQNLTFKEQGRQVQYAVEKIKKQTKKDKVILVGHSMGGLAARAYVQYFNSSDVAGVVTIGTPHLGSFLGELNRKELMGNLDSASNIVKLLAEKFSGISLDSKAVGYLRIGSDELNELNSLAWPENLPIVSIVANDKITVKKFLLYAILTRFYSDPSLIQKMVKYADKQNETVCTTKLLWNYGDGIVPLCSQIAHSVSTIAMAVDNKHRGDIVLENTFHTDAHRNAPEKILEAIDQLNTMVKLDNQKTVDLDSLCKDLNNSPENAQKSEEFQINQYKDIIGGML